MEKCIISRWEKEEPQLSDAIEVCMSGRKAIAGTRRAAAVVGSVVMAFSSHSVIFFCCSLRDGQGVDVEGEHFNAALFAPDAGQLLVERLGDLQRVGGDLVILHLVCRKGGKGRLQGVHQLALQPGCDLGCVILGRNVAAHVGVEQQRVTDAAGEAAVAPQIDRELVAPLPR